MDEESDVQIVDVNEPERESDEFEDGICKKKASTDLFVEIYWVCLYKSIADRCPRI